jgi:hypothetical protein
MASGFTTLTNEHLIRSNVWERQLKELLLDDLNATKFVRMIPDFTDGTTLNIPSLGEAETADFAEGNAIKYNKMDTGNFTFTIDQYIYSANSISAKFKRDSWYSQEVMAAFVPRQHRALMERIEARILSRGNAGQTASSLNAINGGNHRWVGSGTSNSIALQDFAKAQFSLQRANVPLRNLCAVVDPSVAYTLQTQTNLVNLLTPNSRWQPIVNNSAMTGFQFMYNIYGFDVYVSNYLPRGISETVNSVAITNGVANQLFSAAAGDIMPFVGCFRQMPTVYSEFNKDLQQEEYLTITEYGYKLYRPENYVQIMTDTTIVT